MNKEQAQKLIQQTFEQPFHKDQFILFLKDFLKLQSTDLNPGEIPTELLPKIFQPYIHSIERIGEYTNRNTKIDLLIVKLEKTTSLLRARTMQRNLIAWYLKNARDGALVAFVPPDPTNWRFSLIKIDYQIDTTPTGNLKIKETFTHAKRWSFLVGKNEKSHTLQSRLLPLLENDEHLPTLDDLIHVFDVEVVTQDFFNAYRYALKEVVIKALAHYSEPYHKKHSFAQLLLSRIMFLYFLQRKGWFKWQNYTPDKNYIKNLWLKYKEWKKKNQKNNVFYSQWLSSLFFGAFNKKSHLLHPDLPEDIKESFQIMPFLNGGLFSPTELDQLSFDIPDSVFEWLLEPDPNDLKKGFLETFNFTIDESLPIDVDVAVDPEMLGKVYESLIAEEERGETGIFYTPRIEIEFMCRLALSEYLTAQTSLPKTKLIDFIFNPHESTSTFTPQELSLMKKALDNVKIVDPAVGSASFLVGMMNILLELHQEIAKALTQKEENPFALKQKIILENLYGVDVKDWAVMVGELRLWLALIIETDEKYMDIYTKPLLPNLSFKIRQGDALIQEIAGVPINLKTEFNAIPISIRNQIDELMNRKIQFFSGMRSANLKEIKEIETFEQNIFREIVQLRIKQSQNQIKSIEKQIQNLHTQKKLFASEKTKKEKSQINKWKEALEHEKKKLQNYQELLQKMNKKTEKDYFLWELDFIEVFAQKGGFDIVIGNPPYVRQELIAPPLENKNQYTEDQWRKIKQEYKEKLIQSVKSVWNNVKKIDKKSDLYVYFYYQGLSILRPGGFFCFINSNSWLDVGYGAGLQEFLLKNMRPIFIFDNLAKRSFKQADVNTVIVLIQRPQIKPEDYTLKFVAFKKPFEDVCNAKVMKKIENTNQPVFDDADFRIYPKTKKELLLEGVETPEKERLIREPEHLPYIGNKWGGKYLRAPEIYFKILEKGKDKLVRLGDIAEVRRGFTTGANEFFYLKPVDKTVKEVVEIAEKNPNALIRVKNSAGWEGEIEARFLKPLLFSLKEVEKYKVELDLLERLVLVCDKTITSNLQRYIEWGERKNLHKRPSVKSRERWYILPEMEYPHFVSNRFLGERFGFPVVEDILVCDVFFVGRFKDYEPSICISIINSTISYLTIEVIGRKTYGIGVAYIYGPEINNLLTINPKILNKEASFKLQEYFHNMICRPIYSIFTELGFDPSKPIREQEPNPLPDRKALDDIVFDALGLTEEERKEVYWAVAELVKTRLDKAKSV